MSKRITTHIGYKKMALRTEKSHTELSQISQQINQDLKTVSLQQPQKSFEDLITLLAINSYATQNHQAKELSELKQTYQELMERQTLLEKELAQKEAEALATPDESVKSDSKPDSTLSQNNSKASMLNYRPNEKKKTTEKQTHRHPAHAYNPKRMTEQMMATPRQLGKLTQTPRNSED